MFIKEANFSLWCDFLERDFLKSGFRELVDKKIVNGITTNPSIFQNAFKNSLAYKDDISKLRNKNPKEIYEALAIKDIQSSADILSDLYRKNDDGFVSIEIDPFLCDDSKESIKEATRLYAQIDRENVMIKVPATDAGFEVMEELISKDIHVNATLIFSLKQANNCLDAFERGFKRAKKEPSSVISIFVSRFDRKLNLKESLVGIMNATKIYNSIEHRALKNVKALFASTGVKSGNLEKDYYIKELLYKNVINTAPLETIEAFLKNGNFQIKTPISDTKIDQFFDSLKKSKIDIEKVYDELLLEGLDAFKASFEDILKGLKG